MDRKPKNGYGRLKIKYAALEKKCAELQSTVEKQHTAISQLKCDLHNETAERMRMDVIHKRERNEMLEHMGWWRRWTWLFDHKKGED